MVSSREPLKYLLSLPERILRSTLGLGAGVAREVGEVALPEGVRRSRLYQNLVDTTLRFLIENVGNVEGVYRSSDMLPPDFLVRRTAGNAIELLGIVAFRASPVWILAALADVCGMGRELIPEIAEALKAQGLLDKDANSDNDARYTTVDQLLDGLERTSARLAEAVNTPPLDVASLRSEWAAIREDVRSLQPSSLPSRETVSGLWTRLQAVAARQNRSIFETSSLLAISAIARLRSVPEGVRWLSASAAVSAVRAGQFFGSALLDHYKETLSDIQEVGYTTYAARQLGPYVRAAAGQFSPARRTLTGRLLDKLWHNSGR